MKIQLEPETTGSPQWTSTLRRSDSGMVAEGSEMKWQFVARNE